MLIQDDPIFSLTQGVIFMDEITKKQKLITAIQQGNQDESIRLISDITDVDYQDDQGNTALHWAVNKKNLEIITTLIKKMRTVINIIKRVIPRWPWLVKQAEKTLSLLYWKKRTVIKWIQIMLKPPWSRLFREAE